VKKIILSTIVAITCIHAEVTTTDVEGKYTSKTAPIEATDKAIQSIDIGFANVSGNTKTLNLNAKYSLSNSIQRAKFEPFKYNLQLTGFMTKNNGVKTSQEYTALLNGEQELKYNWLGYVALGWLRNEFKNYDNKFSLAVGVGRVLFDDKKHRLIVKIGPAYNIEQYTNGQADKKYGSLNEYLEYTNKLNTYSNLYVKLGAMQNFKDMGEDMEATLLAGVNFAVSENINISLEAEATYDNLPPVGFKKTDTKTIIRLGYKF